VVEARQARQAANEPIKRNSVCFVLPLLRVLARLFRMLLLKNFPHLLLPSTTLLPGTAGGIGFQPWMKTTCVIQGRTGQRLDLNQHWQVANSVPNSRFV
jgi:hypothetical protein